MARTFGEKRFAAQPIQRYYETGKATAAKPGYTPAATRAATPKFDFQSLRVNRLPDASAAPDPNVRRYQLEQVSSTEAAPALRVADANDLAVPAKAGAESKTFFATAAQIQSSNTVLHEAGAPMRLTRRNGRVTVPAHPPHAATKLSQVGTDLTRAALVSSECGRFAQDLLGKAFSTAVVGGAAVPNIGRASSGARDAAIAGALGANAPAAVGANENAAPEVGEAFGIFSTPAQPPQGVMQQTLAALGAVYQKLLGAAPVAQWGEHWAGVVARSGNDRVTMENYNRPSDDTARIEEAIEHDNKELRGLGVAGAEAATANYARAPGETQWARLKRLGRDARKYAVVVDRAVANATPVAGRWYFQMYGPGAQSFHEQWKSSIPNAVTFRLHGTDQALKALLVGQLNALVPNDAYRAGTDATLAAQTLLVNNAVGQAAIRAAYVAAARAVAVARLAAAAAVIRASKKVTVQARIDNEARVGTAAVNAASGDAVAKLAQQHIDQMLAFR
jgi:hypothetical protein